MIFSDRCGDVARTLLPHKIKDYVYNSGIYSQDILKSKRCKLCSIHCMILKQLFEVNTDLEPTLSGYLNVLLASLSIIFYVRVKSRTL